MRVRFRFALPVRSMTRNRSRSRPRSRTSKKASRCAKTIGVAISRAGEKKAVRQQLFKGNEYWFWLGTEVEKATISVHIYDADGKLVEQPDSWQKGHFAAAHVVPQSTGSFFIIVSIEQSPEERTHWALVYGFR